MSRMLSWCLCCLFSFLSTIQAADEEAAKSAWSVLYQDAQPFQVVIQGQNRFAFDLFQKLKSQRGNLLFSPYSIATGLAMVAAGAKGETANEIQRALHYSLSLSPLINRLNQLLKPVEGKNTTQLLLANSIWLQEGLALLPSYQQTIKRNFDLGLGLVDFKEERIKALSTINQWVSGQTKGRVNQVLNGQDLSADTRLVLATAIYMKGAWAHPFDLRQTLRAPFYIRAQHSVQVDMMYTTQNYRLWADQHLTLIEVPYAVQANGAQLAMIILLPKEKMGWQELEAELTLENWQQWKDKLHLQRIHLGMPRFRVEEKLDLRPIMQALGVKEAFMPQANFSAMTGQKELFLNKAVHKTAIRVDEKGTEAAVASVSAPAQVASADAALQELILDHPFFFFIIDQKTQSLLWMGRILYPS